MFNFDLQALHWYLECQHKNRSVRGDLEIINCTVIPKKLITKELIPRKITVRIVKNWIVVVEWPVFCWDIEPEKVSGVHESDAIPQVLLGFKALKVISVRLNLAQRISDGSRPRVERVGVST